MNIALSGAGGTGKGTLAKIFAKKYNYTVLESKTQEIGEALNIKKYNVSNKNVGTTFQWSTMFAHLSQDKAARLFKVNSISERCLWDCIPYFLEKELTDQQYLDYIMKETVKLYDLIVYVPIKFNNTEENIENNPFKERDPRCKANTDNVIRGYCIDKLLNNADYGYKACVFWPRNELFTANKEAKAPSILMLHADEVEDRVEEISCVIEYLKL